VVEPAVNAAGQFSQGSACLTRPAMLILVHAAFWAAAGTLYGAGRAVHPDMLEAYALGQEPAFGYELHPPLVPWIATAWFWVMPHTNWAFFLLAAVTSAIGLVGIAALTRELESADPALAGTMVLAHALLPFHGLMALVFNHNTIQLAVWPWMAFWFVRAVRTQAMAEGAMLGLLAGLALLAKYYAVVLFGALAIAVLVKPKGLGFLSTPAFAAALATFAAVVAPHAAWVMMHGFTTIDYAATKTSAEWLVTAREALLVEGFALLAHLLLAGVIATAVGPHRLAVAVTDGARAHPEVAALGLAPMVITVFIGLLGLAKVSIVFTTPCFYLTPLPLLAPLTVEERARVDHLARRVAAAGAPIVLLALATFPFAVMSIGWSKSWLAKPELAHAVAAEWHKAMPGEPALVVGMAGYPDAVGFYAAPSAKIVRSLRTASDAEHVGARMAAAGGIIVCEMEQTDCLQAMELLRATAAQRRDLTVAPKLLWMSGPPLGFRVLMVPPWAAP
jgi:4-amino-4-deoxy-L-arabinose transferase-like glycosyltransferase